MGGTSCLHGEQHKASLLWGMFGTRPVAGSRAQYSLVSSGPFCLQHGEEHTCSSKSYSPPSGLPACRCLSLWKTVSFTEDVKNLFLRGELFYSHLDYSYVFPTKLSPSYLQGLLQWWDCINLVYSFFTYSIIFLQLWISDFINFLGLYKDFLRGIGNWYF